MQFKALFSVSLDDFRYLIDHLIDHGVTNWLYTSDNELEVSGRWSYPISNICFNHREKVIRIEIEKDPADLSPDMHDCNGIFDTIDDDLDYFDDDEDPADHESSENTMIDHSGHSDLFIEYLIHACNS